MSGALSDIHDHELNEQEFELYISKGSHIHGIFHVRGMARIDGYVEGELHIDRTLQIGKEAVVVADIHANKLIAQGPIRGDVNVRQRIDLLSPARIEGAISAPTFTLERGVQVMGSIKMEQRESDDEM